MTDQDRKLYDMQDGESGPAWQAFVEYRNAGPGERTLAKAARQVGKSASLLERWSRAHDWVRRVRQWDDDCDKRDRERDEVERQNARKRMHDEHARVGKELWRKAASMLGVSGIEDVDKADADRVRVLLSEMKPAEVLGLLKLGMEREARARGEAVGRMDPRVARRFADEMVEIALRYVAEDSQDAYLGEVDAHLALA